MLNLKRPLVFIDLETTGVNIVKDRIIEIAMLKLHQNGTKTMKRYYINPGIPIPPESTLVHKITDDMVASAPTFAQLCGEIHSFIGSCDLAGYNSNKFDFPILVEEFSRAGKELDLTAVFLVDVQNIFHKMEQRTLAAAYKFYCDKTLDNAHSAEADAEATFDVLIAQLEKYPSLKNDVQYLSEFSTMHRNVDLAGRIVFNEKGIEVFNFGKHKGKTVKEVFETEPSYYDWMKKGEFSADTKIIIEKLLNKYKLERAGHNPGSFSRTIK